MSGGQQGAQGRACLLHRVQQAASADAAVQVQIVQHGRLPRGRRPYRPGRVHAQQAEFFIGRVRAGREQAGRAVKQGAGQPFAFVGRGFADASQRHGTRLAVFKPVQARPSQTQPLRQGVAENMPRREPLTPGQIRSQFQQVGRNERLALQRPEQGFAGHALRRLHPGTDAQQHGRPQRTGGAAAQGHGRAQAGSPEIFGKIRRQGIGEVGIGRREQGDKGMHAGQSYVFRMQWQGGNERPVTACLSIALHTKTM